MGKQKNEVVQASAKAERAALDAKATAEKSLKDALELNQQLTAQRDAYQQEAARNAQDKIELKRERDAALSEKVEAVNARRAAEAAQRHAEDECATLTRNISKLKQEKSNLIKQFYEEKEKLKQDLRKQFQGDKDKLKAAFRAKLEEVRVKWETSANQYRSTQKQTAKMCAATKKLKDKCTQQRKNASKWF